MLDKPPILDHAFTLTFIKFAAVNAPKSPPPIPPDRSNPKSAELDHYGLPMDEDWGKFATQRTRNSAGGADHGALLYKKMGPLVNPERPLFGSSPREESISTVSS